MITRCWSIATPWLLQQRAPGLLHFCSVLDHPPPPPPTFSKTPSPIIAVPELLHASHEKPDKKLWQFVRNCIHELWGKCWKMDAQIDKGVWSMAGVQSWCPLSLIIMDEWRAWVCSVDGGQGFYFPGESLHSAFRITPHQRLIWAGWIWPGNSIYSPMICLP